MTRRAGRSTENDPGLKALLDPKTPAVCIVGKTWDFHAHVALGVELDENIAMIGDPLSMPTSKQKRLSLTPNIFLTATNPIH